MWGVWSVVLLSCLTGCSEVAAQGQLEADDLAGPTAEVVAAAKLVLPPLPSFELPPSDQGFVSVRELKVRGRRHLDRPVQLRGYVTWIYDCASALAAKNPKAKKASIQKAIDADPSLCDRPRLTLGDSKTASREESVLVVEVPRPPSKGERQKLSKQELASWPAVPKVSVGDHVTLAARWTKKTPRGDADPNGLLVYGALEATPPPAVAAAASSANASAGSPDQKDPPPFVITEAPKRKVVPTAVRAASITQLGDCTRKTAARDLDGAIVSCRAATATWEGNHLAWYTLASAHMAKGQWPEARATVARSVALRPDLAMYQLYHGVALYEEEQQADGAGLDKGHSPDVGSPGLIAARDALRRAARLNPQLWRAHFYLGRVYLDLDDAKRAAEQLRATVEAYPSYRYAYVSLVELLRRWGYLDAALAYARLGAQHVVGAEASELWVEVGLLHEAKRADAPAIEAFGKALKLAPGDGRALLQRGQVLFRVGDKEGARRDLTAALRSPDPRLTAARPFMQELLARIDATRR